MKVVCTLCIHSFTGSVYGMGFWEIASVCGVAEECC